MTRWGEVSYRVKRAISFHERFTISQVADSTGLTYEQVEQVVHRLVDRGDVCRLLPEQLTEAEQEVEERVGRPYARYTLADDPIRRAEFLAGLEAVAAALRLQFAPDRRPDTPYYEAALRAIEAMEAGEERARLSRLKEIEEFLVYGREYEALVPEGLEIVQAYYDVALARLKSLDKDFLAAQRLLVQAEAALVRAGLGEEVRSVTDRRSVVQMEQALDRVDQALDRVDQALQEVKAPLWPRENLVSGLEQLRESLLQNVDSLLCVSLCRVIDSLIRTVKLVRQLQVENWVLSQHVTERSRGEISPETPWTYMSKETTDTGRQRRKGIGLSGWQPDLESSGQRASIGRAPARVSVAEWRSRESGMIPEHLN